MSTEIAIRETPSAVILSETQLNFIANTEFVPKAFRGKLPAIMACVATGRALGLPDMTALRSIHIIDGKATFSAELMVQLVRAHGHSITGDISGDRALVRGRRVDNGDEMTCEWTLEMAKRAGLLAKQNWKSYPEAMLWARAVSQLCRMLFADCFAGATYTPEEGEFTADELMDEPAGELVETTDEEIVQQSGAAASPQPSHAAASDDYEVATEAQQKLILVKANQAGLDDDARHELIEGITGQPSSKMVPRHLVNEVLAAIDERAAA